jgi:hypothetical protein
VDKQWAEETRRRARIMLMAANGAPVEFQCRDALRWTPAHSGYVAWDWQRCSYRLAEPTPPPLDGTCNECECCQVEDEYDEPRRAVLVLKDTTVIYGYEDAGGSPFRVQLVEARTVDDAIHDAGDAIDLALRGPIDLCVSDVIPRVTIPDPTLIIECTPDATLGWEAL